MRTSCLLEAVQDRFGEMFNLCMTKNVSIDHTANLCEISLSGNTKVAEKQDIYTEKICIDMSSYSHLQNLEILEIFI